MNAPFDPRLAMGTSVSALPTKRIFAVAVADLEQSEAIALLGRTLRAGTHLRIAFLNAHAANVARADERFRACMERFLILPDGIGVDLGARILSGAPFRANLNGTDFVPKLLQSLDGPLTVALVGGVPGIAERAAEKLRQLAPQHEIHAVSDGYFGEAGRAEMLERLEALAPDITLLAMGVPIQELFIQDHLSARHGRLVLGVGALFDFLSGNARRAPRLVRRFRLEWLFRLMLEPRRLARRYLYGNPAFLAAVLREKLARGRSR